MRKNLPVSQQEYDYPGDETLLSVTDLKGHITYANAAFVRISGFEYDELLGKAHNIVRHPDMPPEAYQDLWDTLKQGRSWTAVVKNRRKDGDHYWVRANVAPVYHQDTLSGYLSVRTKPSREEIAAAERVCATFQAGRPAGRFHHGLLMDTGWRRWRNGARTQSLRQRLALTLGSLIPLWAGLAWLAGLWTQPVPISLGNPHAPCAVDKLGCVGMLRAIENGFDIALFNHRPMPHHQGAIGHAPDKAYVVADQQDAHVAIPPQIVQDANDFALHGRVERCRRLVQDEKGRLQRDRHGDGDALLHPAGQLMRIALEHGLRIPHMHALKEFGGTAKCLSMIDGAVLLDGLGHLLADPDRRVQGRAGMLIDRRHPAAAKAAQLPEGHGRKVAPLEEEAVGRGHRSARQIAQDAHRDRTLARAGFTDQPEGLAARKRHRHAPGRRVPAIVAFVPDAEIVDGKDRKLGGLGWIICHGQGSLLCPIPMQALVSIRRIRWRSTEGVT